nr:DEAD/DEAH box helicase [Nocardia farcinica]
MDHPDAFSPATDAPSGAGIGAAQEVLRRVFGYDSFRGDQAAIVEHVIGGGDALVLMPTGGGKSLCYQVPALVRPGVGVVVSPLIALMQDQVDALSALGVRAGFLNSTQFPDERATVEAHNAAIAAGAPDPVGKPAEFCEPVRSGPYWLLDVGIKPSVINPCPMLTLGGVVVDETTGAVRSTAGHDIPGLFAAGRTAVGICSDSYVSGLSLADCVFSGRRAGRSAAGVLEQASAEGN